MIEIERKYHFSINILNTNKDKIKYKRNKNV